MTIEQSRQRLLATVGAAPELTVVRGYGNVGDALIWAGTRQLLRGHIYREIDLDDLLTARGDTVLLCGGGAWSRQYCETMPTALAVAERRFRRVIVAPSSFDTAADIVASALRQSSATFFARELESYRRIRGLCNAEFSHDAAFHFDYRPFVRAERSGTLTALRTDAESAGLLPLPAGNVDISATIRELPDWLDVIARHETVITDRAHVMIAAAHLGVAVRYVPGRYFKVAALAATLPPTADVAPYDMPDESARFDPFQSLPPRAVRNRIVLARTGGPDSMIRTAPQSTGPTSAPPSPAPTSAPPSTGPTSAPPSTGPTSAPPSTGPTEFAAASPIPAPNAATLSGPPAAASEPSEPRVAAVILSHNRPDLLPTAVASVLAAGALARVVIVDNNSDPVTRRTLRSLADLQRVSVVALDINVGCAGGRERGRAMVTDEDFVLFLDDDAELLPGSLEALVADLDAFPQAQATTAHVVDAAGLTLNCGGSFEVDSEFARFTPNACGTPWDAPTLPESGPCDWVGGTAVLIRRSALEHCPLDPAMVAYYEDNDWALRMTARFPGYPPFRHCRDAIAIHRFGARPTLGGPFALARHLARRLQTLAYFAHRHDRLLISGGTEIQTALSGLGELADDPAAIRLLLRAAASMRESDLAVELLAGDAAAVLPRLAQQHQRSIAVAQERDALLAQQRVWSDERAQLVAEVSRRQAEVAELSDMLQGVLGGRWWRLRERIADTAQRGRTLTRRAGDGA